MKLVALRKSVTIILISFSTYTASLENILPSLTAQQKKIHPHRFASLGILAIWYMAKRCCFAAELMNGPGKKTYPDGTVEEGEFKDDQLHGQGKATYRGRN